MDSDAAWTGTGMSSHEREGRDCEAAGRGAEGEDGYPGGHGDPSLAPAEPAPAPPPPTCSNFAHRALISRRVRGAPWGPGRTRSVGDSRNHSACGGQGSRAPWVPCPPHAYLPGPARPPLGAAPARRLRPAAPTSLGLKFLASCAHRSARRPASPGPGGGGVRAAPSLRPARPPARALPPPEPPVRARAPAHPAAGVREEEPPAPFPRGLAGAGRRWEPEGGGPGGPLAPRPERLARGASRPRPA